MGRPELLVHCDWSTDARKRWMASAEVSAGKYRVTETELVGDASTLFSRIRERAGGGRVLAGFDFPIGVPQAYAKRAGVGYFPDWLLRLGEGVWREFYEPAERADQIGLGRPFYPRRPGGTKRQHLLDGLQLADASELLRWCDRGTANRGNACPVFWTLGGNQAGRAAIHGWREMLAPALRSGSVRLWPFEGQLEDLLNGGGVVVAEVYPAEVYGHVGVRRNFGKRRQAGRSGESEAILTWCEGKGVELTEEMRESIREGFGASQEGEDRFDAVLGLLGVIEAAGEAARFRVPEDAAVREVEGWILGTGHD